MKSSSLLLIIGYLIQLLTALDQSHPVVFQTNSTLYNTSGTSKRILLRLAALKDIGIKLNPQNGHYSYDSNMPFVDLALTFHNAILEDYRKGLKESLGISISPDFKGDIIGILETKLSQLGYAPLKEFLIQVYELRDELSQMKKKQLSQEQQQDLATRILAPLDQLYERTYGTYIKQDKKDKYMILMNCPDYGEGLKKTFDARREVYGMKNLSSMPKTFMHFHAKAERISSQYDQDGVIKAIFEAISSKHNNKKYFVEVGGGSQIDNTAYLRNKAGWKGHLFNSGNYFMDRTSYPITNQFVDPFVAEKIFKKYNIPKEFDFLSIDIDSRDCYVWSALAKQYKPAVVSIQFNPNFGPDVAVSQPIRSKAFWGGDKKYLDKYYGCSSRVSYDIATQHGYGLVYLHPFTDMFFVRKDLLPAQLPPLNLHQVFDAIPLHKVDVQFRTFQFFQTKKLQENIDNLENENKNENENILVVPNNLAITKSQEVEKNIQTNILSFIIIILVGGLLGALSVRLYDKCCQESSKQYQNMYPITQTNQKKPSSQIVNQQVRNEWQHNVEQ